MNSKYLVINAGSSSLKFSLYEMPEAKEIVNGYVEKIGNEDSFYTLKYNGEKIRKEKIINNHNDAVLIMLAELLSNNFIINLEEIKGIGHRVVHGGEKYSDSVLITDEVIKDIENLTKFATLHHPGNLAGINAMREALPNAVQVAVFDTAFHQTMPEENYIYPVPYQWYEKYGVRKYGFHGTSHKYITEVMQEKLGKENVNLIVCHIGSGASISCIKEGKCFDTTMGLTPLDGLMMGTRSGSIDASILEYICKETNKSVAEITSDLNKKSGLLGISGASDFRDVEELAKLGNTNAKLTIRMFENSIIKNIGQYYFELNGKIDAIVFTAGIGENAINLRERIINKISGAMPIYLDGKKNSNIAGYKDTNEGIITTNYSKFPVYVVPTNEEYMILSDTYNICNEYNKENLESIRRVRK